MKRKLEKNGNKRRTNHWCNIFFIVCLVITLSIQQSLQDWLYESYFAFTPVLCFVITAFIVLLSSAHVASSVAMQPGSHLRRGWARDYSCNLTMRVTYFILEQGEHFYSCSLVPRPTCSFDCLQCVKQIMASYPGPGYNSPIPNHCSHPQILPNAEILVF